MKKLLTHLHNMTTCLHVLYKPIKSPYSLSMIAQCSASAKDMKFNWHCNITCMISDEQVVTQALERGFKLATQMLCYKDIHRSVH